MSKYYWIVNLDRCIGCETCVVACKQENTPLPGVQYRKMHYVNPEQYPQYPTFRITRSCNHCEEPACVPACPVKAYRKEEGLVLHNSETCIGCKYCLWVCPNDAPQYAEAKGKMEKCNLCQPRLKRGLNPACADACPTGALRLVEHLEGQGGELMSEIPGYPTQKTKAKIRFINKRRPTGKRSEDR